MTNGIWTDRNGVERAVYGEAGDVWCCDHAMRESAPTLATYEPTAWDEQGNETEWQVIDEKRIAGTIVFPEE